MLNNIRIIMIGTTLPANIGSAARAMHTMGLQNLYVVNPKLPIDDNSVANAAGGTSVLNQARVVQTLDEALADCQMVFAASARTRHLPKPVVTPDVGADIMKQFLQKSPSSNIAILFGREDRGLTNDELARADFHIQISANPEYPVLNVASAIQVIASFIYANFQNNRLIDKTTKAEKKAQALEMVIRTEWDEPPISHAQKQSLDDALINLLVQLNLARDDELKDLPKRLARLSGRLQLDQKEYALLRALLAKITQNLHQN